ncbi:MAG TPA: lipid-transfer protein [Acidimicrobiia bacterium]|nr:lipid-transfer protein [Acidimicrobiia bacterium]
MTNTIVAGIGATEFSKQSGRSEMRLAAEASRAAILDAGLSPGDIDGMVTFTVDGNDEQELMRNLGAGPVTWWSRTPGGGTGACAAMQQAVAAVESGVANAVLVYRAFNERSGYRYGQPHAAGGPPPLDWYRNFGVDTPAKMYALWFRRYMHAFGATNEDFGRYTVSARRYAATNPKAWFHDRPITLDDHQASRWIVEPVLRLYDCCQESDGGVALVVTRADRTTDVDAPVAIRAVADARHPDASITANYYYDDLARYPEAAQCAQLLFDRSGLTPADIDVAEIYENFSPLVFLVLEAYGFCGPGEAAGFIADGNLDIDGALPTNTHGGLLGEAYIHGINSIQEGVRQVRGTAVNQVADVEHCLVSSLNSGLVLGRV